MHRFDIAFPKADRRTCRVRAGRGVFRDLEDDLVNQRPGGLLVVIADSRVAPLHAEPLVHRLRARGLSVELLTFLEGEGRKVRATKDTLEDRMFELGVGRDAMIVAVGGGVTGDLAGFVASTWHRGIPVIQVPTSLLAMADAALGGKTAVDLPGGKNFVGAFHQPLGVYADVDVLQTLADDRFVEGFAEIVKSAVIADAGLFRKLEQSVDRLLARDLDLLADVVGACMRIKGRVVRRDERESGRRAVLNFGHTVAHAVETVSDYRERHGAAVSYGMVVESRLAIDSTDLPRRHAERIKSLLEAYGLPVTRARGLPVEDLVTAAHRDKKARSGEVHYSLPLRIGRMRAGDDVTVVVDDRRLRAAIDSVDDTARAN